MPLDWLNTPLDADIGELLAQRKRGKAIELLRRQVQGRLAPSVTVRLQLADLLMQAGRVEEAIPVLLGLADEFATDGFVAKAVAILKRVERVQPGRPDVGERLERLVIQQRRSADQRPPAGAPELGIEEIGDDEDPFAAAAEVADAEPEPAAPAQSLAAEPEAVEPQPAEPEAPPPLPILDAIEVEPEVDVARSAEPDTTPAPVEAIIPEPAAEAAADGIDARPAPDAGVSVAGDQTGVGRRIRRALWRFLASLPGAEQEGAAGVPAAAASDTAAAPEPSSADLPVANVEVRSDEPAPAEAVAEPSPSSSSDEPDLLASLEASVDGEAAMSEDAFRDHLLDIVEDVLQRPPAPETEAVLERTRALDLARRMIGSRLFRDLSDEELLAIVRGLRLHTFEPGAIVVTEGEPGQSLFTLASGRVKVFVANPDGRNFEVAVLDEGDFFGEISSLSGRPRSATVVAASACELLELDRPTLDSIARTHARVRDVLETSYIERASSPEAAAVRAVPLPDSGTRRKAIEVLEAHFGESRWDPRMRLRLADVLLKAGKAEEAVPILVGLADELAREGFADKAVAILKKIEQVQRRNVEVVNLAPLLHGEAAPTPPAAAAGGEVPAAGPRARAVTDERFHGWLVDLVRDTVSKGHERSDPGPAAASALKAYGPGLFGNPLFEDFSEEELLAFIRGLKLLTFEPGDILISEGEPGQSVFLLTTGRVKVFVRGAHHHSVALAALEEGSFFGEISTLSGRPRSATITAAAACEILELDRPGLDSIAATHPRVREVLEAFSAARADDAEAARARGHAGC